MNVMQTTEPSVFPSVDDVMVTLGLLGVAILVGVALQGLLAVLVVIDSWRYNRLAKPLNGVEGNPGLRWAYPRGGRIDTIILQERQNRFGEPVSPSQRGRWRTVRDARLDTKNPSFAAELETAQAKILTEYLLAIARRDEWKAEWQREVREKVQAQEAFHRGEREYRERLRAANGRG